MTPRTVRELISGPAGRIECALDRPAATPLGLALGERLLGRQVDDEVALGGDLGRLHRLRGSSAGEDDKKGDDESARKRSEHRHWQGGEVRETIT